MKDDLDNKEENLDKKKIFAHKKLLGDQSRQHT